jgi:hypothetical protein
MCQGNCYGFSNVADAGTKPLASKRSQMLLHCIGMARADGGQTIGQEEYEVQFHKYSSGKQISALAKNISRVIVFMGLEPLQGATAMPLGGDEMTSLDSTPNAALSPIICKTRVIPGCSFSCAAFWF